MKQFLRILKWIGITLAVLLAILVTAAVVASRRSVIPDNMNMGAQTMPGMPGTATLTPVTGLSQPPTDAPVRQFTLTAETTRIDLGNANIVDAYTFNGSVPGPELRV